MLKAAAATHFHIYWKIVLPLSFLVIATVAIRQSLEYWNAYLWPLMSRAARRCARSRWRSRSSWGPQMVISVMMSLPVLMLYLGLQRWFIQSVVGSAVKG